MSQEIDFRPTGPVRPNSIYVSWRLHKAFGYIARKTGLGREDLVETVLAAWVAAEHPEIEAWITQREAEEREFTKKLQTAKEKTEKYKPTTEGIPT